MSDSGRAFVAWVKERAEADALRGFRVCRDYALLFARNCVATLLAASWFAGGKSVWPVAVMLAIAALTALLAADCVRFAVTWARIHHRATGRWPWRGT